MYLLTYLNVEVLIYRLIYQQKKKTLHLLRVEQLTSGGLSHALRLDHCMC